MKLNKIKSFYAVIITVFLMLTLTACDSSTVNSPNSNENKNVKIHYIDVGQGDSTLIQVRDKNILIDAGPRSSAEDLVKYLKDINIQKLDYVIATHPHEDHIGGMVSIIKTFKIGEFYAPKKTATTKTFENMIKELQNKKLKIQVAKAGNEISLNSNSKLEFLAPNSSDYEEINDYSAVTKLTYEDNSFIFMGDAERLSEKEILQKGSNVKAQVIKLGHHGSSTSSSKEFLDKVDPKYAIISCGKNNDYGHPHKETINELKNRNIKYFRTDTNGTIVLYSDGKNIEFKNNR
ncbi:ComEC/Rec2 family competence protein [Desnuesiella massiliensis]|uniref:ComEC/Rec2 family competence protein n=1 Tax=Desnuesiella massiliensis TaxID=1650662 RepID=UPI0006E25FA0|nr:ComEC/Rec2 family competence protein [Desnuesiella massiliensis]